MKQKNVEQGEIPPLREAQQPAPTLRGNPAPAGTEKKNYPKDAYEETSFGCDHVKVQ